MYLQRGEHTIERNRERQTYKYHETQEPCRSVTSFILIHNKYSFTKRNSLKENTFHRRNKYYEDGNK